MSCREEVEIYEAGNRAYLAEKRERPTFEKAFAEPTNPLVRIGFNGFGGGIDFTMRRTDSDRRPARVVRRENDGPGCWEERMRRSEAIRIAQESKSQRAVAAQAVARPSAELEAMILAALPIEPRGIRAVSLDVEISENRASVITSTLVAKGLITKEEVKVVRHGDAKCICTITEAGLEMLAVSR